YDNIPGSDVRDLRGSPSFPSMPTSVEIITNSFAAKKGHGTNYGSYIRGYIEAPQTGNYIFYLAGNDTAHFYLCLDSQQGNPQPGSLVLIARCDAPVVALSF